MLKFIKRKKWFFLIAFLVIIGIAAFFFFRRSPENKLIDTQKENSESAAPGNQTSAENITSEDQAALEEEAEDVSDIPITEDDDLDVTGVHDSAENVFANITAEHCNRRCEAFSDQAKYFEYCKQVCSLAGVKNVSNCDGKSGLDKDYCLKDLAVSKKNSSYCTSILDENVKKTCRSRVLEDQLENQVHEPVD